MFEMIDTEKMMDTAKMIQANTVEMGKTALYAGVGVVAIVEEQGKKVIDGLVEKGKGYEFQAKTPAMVTEVMDKATEQVKDAFAKIEGGVQDAGKAVLHRVGLPSHDEIQALITRVEQLAVKVEGLNKKEKH